MHTAQLAVSLPFLIFVFALALLAWLPYLGNVLRAGDSFWRDCRGVVSSMCRYETVGDIAMANTNTVYNPSTNGGLIPNDRFLKNLRFEWEGRITNPASGNPSGVLGDAPYSILDYVSVVGYNRATGQKVEFMNVRLSDLRQLTKIYASGNSVPFTTGTSLSLTANATNDIRFVIDIPLVPLGLSAAQQMLWLLDAPNWDQLTFNVRMGDDKSVFKGQTNPCTFSAYASATGNPRLRWGITVAMSKAKFAGFVPGRVWRTYQENTSGDIINGATGSRLVNTLPKGYLLRSVLMKSGTKGTGVNAPNNAYDVLSNSIFSNIKVMQGTNKLIRYWADLFQLQQDGQSSYGNLPDTGYGLIDFAQNGTIGEALQTAGLTAGPTGDVDLFPQADIAGAANQGELFLYEELRNNPGKLTANMSQLLAQAGANRPAVTRSPAIGRR